MEKTTEILRDELIDLIGDDTDMANPLNVIDLILENYDLSPKGY